MSTGFDACCPRQNPAENKTTAANVMPRVHMREESRKNRADIDLTCTRLQAESVNISWKSQEFPAGCYIPPYRKTSTAVRQVSDLLSCIRMVCIRRGRRLFMS